MNSRGVAVQGGLAAASLVAAYFTWQRQPELVAGEVFALDIGKSELERVRYEDMEMKSFAELVRDKDENGTFVSVHLSGSDATGVPMPSSHPAVPIKVPERFVRGNEAAQRLFEKMAPLRASRALGVLDAAKLKDLALDTTKKRLEVVGRGSKRRFAIAPAPPGGLDPYLRDEQDGRVYIVSRAILSDLQAATTNLVERRLHSFKLEDIDRVVVYGAGKKKEFRANRIEEMPGVRLSPVGSDKADETAKNWHDRVWNLFPSEVMGRGESPGDGTPKTAIRVEYFMRGRTLGWVELARKPAPAANESTTAPAPPAADAAFGRSEYTLGWMKLTQDANALITEGETLVGRP
jgi:hypothetical protein